MSLVKKSSAAVSGITRIRDCGEQINLYSGEALAGIRVACEAAAEVLERLCAAVVPGISTLELDELAGGFMKDCGCVSADLGYEGFPRQVCISLNDEVVHGIGRRDVIIREGDLVSLDVTVRKAGFVGDNARTVCAGGVCTELGRRLMSVTEASLQAGIAAAVSGKHVHDIGAAVEDVVTAAGFSVVRDMVGHGCGKDMHESPMVPNYHTRGTAKLRPGMVLAIEPMVNVGTWRVKIDRGDHWTVRTADGSLSAHFEHQILITEQSAEVLTWPKSASK